MISPIYKNTLRIFLMIACCFVLAILYLIEPFWRFRIWHLPDERMGHLTSDIDLFFRKWRVEGKPRRTSYLFVASNPANAALLEMWKRVHPILIGRVWSRLYFAVLPVLKRTRFYHPGRIDFSDAYLFDLAPPTLSFTEEEENLGRKLLQEMGIGPSDWFICFQTRDPKYRDTNIPHEEALAGGTTNRDCNILNYLPAASYIAELGGFALRMNAATDSTLPADCHPRIIDYANKSRNEFMDVYACAKAKLFLGCTSGMFLTASIFDTPCALANFIPAGERAHRRSHYYIPKLYRDRVTGEYVSFQKIYDLGLFLFSGTPGSKLVDCDQTYLDLGIWPEENSGDDVLDLTRDLLDLINGKPPSAEAIAAQKEFRLRFLKFFDDMKHAENAGDIGPSFALKYHRLFG